MILSGLVQTFTLSKKMAQIKKFQTLEESIEKLQQTARTKPLTIAEILLILSGKGQFFVLILLSLPFCQPIQIPGLAIPFGLVISLIGWRFVFGKRIWLPQKISSKTIPSERLEKLTLKTLKLLKKATPWLHPRYLWLCRSVFMKKSNGTMIGLLGLFLALPIPFPLSNMVAAWSIFLIVLGILKDDGLFVLIGYGASLITIVFFLTLAFTLSTIIS